MAAPIGAVNQRAIRGWSEDGQRRRGVGRRRCDGRVGHSRIGAHQPGLGRGRCGTEIPEYPTVNLTVCIFYLAQLTIVGDNYTGPALFVDDLLTGEAPRRLLRRSGGCGAAEHQDSECQRHPVHDFASPLACLEHIARRRSAMVMLICRQLMNLTGMPQINLKVVRDAILPPSWTAPVGAGPLFTESGEVNEVTAGHALVACDRLDRSNGFCLLAVDPPLPPLVDPES